MNIKDVKSSKSALEEKIYELFHEFESNTGCTIEDIDIVRYNDMTGTFINRCDITIGIK